MSADHFHVFFQSSVWYYIQCDIASLRVLLVECAWVCVLAHWMHGMCASWYRVCYREGLQARQCNVTGVLGARGSAHCALGFKPSLCPACHGRCVLLHRRGAGLPTPPADSLLPSCGYLKLVFFHSKNRQDRYDFISHDALGYLFIQNHRISIYQYIVVIVEITDMNYLLSACLFRCMPLHLVTSTPETMEDILVLSLELSTLALSTCKVTFRRIFLEWFWYCNPFCEAVFIFGKMCLSTFLRRPLVIFWLLCHAGQLSSHWTARLLLCN